MTVRKKLFLLIYFLNLISRIESVTVSAPRGEDPGTLTGPAPEVTIVVVCRIAIYATS